jgi:hypothetical protein
VGLVVFEVLLQILALAAPRLMQRAVRGGDGDAFRILCIGDSHTYGWAVERSEAYPSRLEALLDESARGATTFDVVNLGVPASNSSQLVRRLPAYIERYQPDLVIVTIGSNDDVNSAESALLIGESGPGRLQRWLMRLRSYRLIVLALHQRRLVRSHEVRASIGEGVEVQWQHPWRGIQMRDGDYVERFQHRVDFDVLLSEEEHERLLRRNLREVARIAGDAGVPVVFASYTQDFTSAGVANRVMREVPDALFVSQLFRSDLKPHLPEMTEEERAAGYFFKDMHPKAPVYHALASNLHDALIREGLVPIGP